MKVDELIDYWMEKKEYDREIIEYKRICILFLISLLIILLLVLNLNFKITNVDLAHNKRIFTQTQIGYINLNKSTQIYAKSLLNGIKESYLHASKELYFTIDKEEIEKLCDGLDCIGVNMKPEKIIYVYLTGDEYTDKNTLCHEILHSMISIENDEWFVYDLALNEVCYGN